MHTMTFDDVRILEKQMLTEIEKLETRYDHSFEVSRQVGLALWMKYPEELVARCVRCKQLVLVRKNLESRPILFGRWSWRPLHMEGLPVRWYCTHLQRQLSAFPSEQLGPYRAA